MPLHRNRSYGVREVRHCLRTTLIGEGPQTIQNMLQNMLSNHRLWQLNTPSPSRMSKTNQCTLLLQRAALHLLVPPLGCHRAAHPQRTLKRRSLARKNREQGALPCTSCENTERSRTALALSTHTSSLTSRSFLHSAAQTPPPSLPSQRHTQPLPSDELWALSCLCHHRGLQNKPGSSEV